MTAMCEIFTFIGVEVAKTIIALGTTAFVGGIIWAITVGNRTKLLNALVSNPDRAFILYYRGIEDRAKHKIINFNRDGMVGGASNSNEHHWKIGWGSLKIYTSGNVEFSEFIWDAKQARLVHTNNPNLPSVMGQYIIPSFIPAVSQPEIYGVQSNDE